MDTKNSGQAASSGLEGVVVADTRLSDVDGERGKLIIGGFDVEELGGRACFEAICARLWRGVRPDADGEAIESLRQGLGQARLHAHRQLDSLGDALTMPDGMDALRAAMSH